MSDNIFDRASQRSSRAAWFVGFLLTVTVLSIYVSYYFYDRMKAAEAGQVITSKKLPTMITETAEEAGVKPWAPAGMKVSDVVPAAPTPSPASSTGDTHSTASTVCKEGDTRRVVTATATGNGARALAECGGSAKQSKAPSGASGKRVAGPSAVKTPPAVVVQKPSQLPQNPGPFAPAPSKAKEGEVYSDGAGNTFERHTGGSRLCKFFVNGELRKEVFVQNPDPVASKRECDLLSQQFLAGLKPTSPDDRIFPPPEPPVVQQPPVALPPSAGQPTGGGYKVATQPVCEFRIDGKLMETAPLVDPQCKAWTQEQARKRGLIPRQ